MVAVHLSSGHLENLDIYAGWGYLGLPRAASNYGKTRGSGYVCWLGLPGLPLSSGNHGSLNIYAGWDYLGLPLSIVNPRHLDI